MSNSFGRTVRWLMLIALAALAVGALFASPSVDAMCRPGSVSVLPKPHVELPRCDPPPQ